MNRLLALLSFTLLSSTAMAADAIVDVEPVPVVEEVVVVGDWTGFYAGIQLGGAFGDTDELELDPFTFPGLVTAFTPPGEPAGSSFNAAGDFDGSAVGGVHIGYDHQFANNIVLGGILDVSYYDISDRQKAFSRTPAIYQIERELDYLVTARARLGYVFHPRVMGYVTGGLAFGEVDFNYSQPGSTASFTTSGDQDSDFGYTVGAGVEGLVTERISLGVEYLYTNLGDNDFQANLTGGPFGGPGGFPGSNPDGTTLTGGDEDFDFHTVQLRLSYRF
ncbi:MAG TPA: outer membrane beta-barrel protein [Mesorhizobium sp.]|jgi:outer membrane immunogenic protein|nr:outer membrane beta-barrel protein [Mesorhizobium sp.]